jgi:stress-induced morphogen
MYTPEKIQSLVEAAFPGAQAQVRDMTGTLDHYELLVVSKAFEGKGLVERHRMVYAALGPAVGGEIHALSLKTLTPLEAERK